VVAIAMPVALLLVVTGGDEVRGQVSADQSTLPGRSFDAGEEQVGMRTERSRTFRRSDGLLVTRVWQHPVHFRDGDQWRAYDSTL
jgi:hypothetical protein